MSTVAYLARKFIAYFQVVHQQSIGRLRADMQSRGGFILHIDGTCEEGSGVLLVGMDSLSGQVLESRKISSDTMTRFGKCCGMSAATGDCPWPSFTTCGEPSSPRPGKCSWRCSSLSATTIWRPT